MKRMKVNLHTFEDSAFILLPTVGVGKGIVTFVWLKWAVEICSCDGMTK